MATDDLRGRVQTAYRDALEHLRARRDDATRRVQDAMSATPGWQAAAKAAAAHAVLVESQCEMEAQLETIFAAYIDRGERNGEAVARELRERLLSGLEAPGLSFFEGSGPEVASLAPIALRHAAEFESWRDALASGAAGRYGRALEAHVERSRSTEGPRGRDRVLESRIVVGSLLLTAAMSLCGLSWLDVLRRALALF